MYASAAMAFLHHFAAFATVVLVVGMLRVAFFEKGREYYWHDLYFLIKFSAFIAAALISIYPTVTFLSWSKGLKAGVAPEVPEARSRRVRLCLMLELAAPDRAELLGEPEQFRIRHRGRQHCLHRRHAVLHHEGELARVVAEGAH